VSYAYDAHGDRIFKRGPGGETVYANQFFTVRNRNLAIKHIYVGGTRLASIVSKLAAGERGPPIRDRDVYFYHPDHMQGTQFVTDGAGELREHFRYFPSGEPWIEERRGPKVTDLRFSGREYDTETGLYYLGARYYDPALGHFISVDPMSAAPPSEAESWTPPALNVYAYAYGNPVRLTDPDGLAPAWWSSLRRTAGFFSGVSGRSVRGSRDAGQSILQRTDSPVRAAAASSTAEVVADAGAGVIHGDASRAARITSRRDMGGAAVRASPAAPRAPPGTSAMLRAGDVSRPPVVLGENMVGRVIPFAKSVGGETIVDWLAGRSWTQQLNDDFIEHIKAEGRQILDIGPDFSRRLRFHLDPPSDRGGRPVYDSERELLRGYGKRTRLFVRTGRFAGGVPGFDQPSGQRGGVSGMKP
jgi:RHS repeat-associated protein